MYPVSWRLTHQNPYVTPLIIDRQQPFLFQAGDPNDSNIETRAVRTVAPKAATRATDLLVSPEHKVELRAKFADLPSDDPDSALHLLASDAGVASAYVGRWDRILTGVDAEAWQKQRRLLGETAISLDAAQTIYGSVPILAAIAKPPTTEKQDRAIAKSLATLVEYVQSSRLSGPKAPKRLTGLISKSLTEVVMLGISSEPGKGAVKFDGCAARAIDLKGGRTLHMISDPFLNDALGKGVRSQLWLETPQSEQADRTINFMTDGAAIYNSGGPLAFGPDKAIHQTEIRPAEATELRQFELWLQDDA